MSLLSGPAPPCSLLRQGGNTATVRITDRPGDQSSGQKATLQIPHRALLPRRNRREDSRLFKACDPYARQTPGATITLVPIAAEKFVHVLDGYEYRPNLEPVGLVRFDGGNDRGGSSQVPYGFKDGRYYLPGTVRRKC